MNLNDPINDYPMGVTADQRGKVQTLSEAATKARNSYDTFIVYATDANAADITENDMFLIENDESSLVLVIDKISFSANLPGIVRLKKNVTYTAATGTAATPLNTNFNSSQARGVTAVYTDAMTISGGTTFAGKHIAANSTAEFDFDGSVILGKDQNVCVFFKGAAGSETIEGYILYHFE